jgi:gas vesicle protein
MFKLLLGAALGFAAAWFMDSKEGEQRRTLVKDKATSVAGKGKDVAGKGKEQAVGAVNQVKQKRAASSGSEPVADAGASYESATAGEPIAESAPTTAPGPETFRQE